MHTDTGSLILHTISRHMVLTILLLTLPERIVDIHTYNLEMTVSHIQCFSEVLSYAEKNKTPVSIHLKIDTDMHRQGFNITEKEHMVDILSTHTNKIHLKGVYSHFANAKDPAHTEKTQSQLNVFLEWKRSVTETGMSPLFHISATGATFLHPEAHFDMVRIGMGLYGYYPSKDIETNYKACNLQPILKWKSIVSEIKKVEAGETIGYGTSYTTKSPTIIGIVPVGYWHGYDKGFSNVGLVRIENTNVPVIGLISMDMILINISQVPDISIGDEVILLDNTVPEMQATTLAESIHTSPYEILTRINPLIHKIYL